MSRQLEQVSEQRTAKRHLAIVRAVEYELDSAVQRAGGVLTGFAYKGEPGAGLLVLKAILAGKPQVAFVGGEDFGSCLIKAVREANRDKLKWREDRYGT